MNIFNRIRFFFFPSEYYSAEHLNFKNPSLEFEQLGEETILSIKDYLKQYLFEVEKIATKSLKSKNAFEFENIDALVLFVIKALEFDQKEMQTENWKFKYFINHYFLDNKTICIYNKFTNPETEVGNMVITLISVRMFNAKYYCWLNIDDYEPAGNSGLHKWRNMW